MAELAAGAVSSLLGVIKDEAKLLRRIGNDVEFIKEEMESMNSFLEHLARSAPPGGSHDKQVRTWMKQVRDLAHDCSNCIDHYLHRGDPAIHRARAGFRRHVWWLSWFVQEWIAQHKAAVRLRELKDRASEVGKRRLRYGVEIPGNAAAGGSTSAAVLPSSSRPFDALAVAEDDEEGEDDRHQAAVAASSHPYLTQQGLEPPTLDDYFLNKIVNWVVEPRDMSEPIRSIAIVATDNTSALHEGFSKARAQFQRTVWIKLSLVHYYFDKLGPNKVLCYILRACQLQEKHKDQNYVEVENSRYNAWMHRRQVKGEIRKKYSHGIIEDKIKQIQDKIEDFQRKIPEETGVMGNKNKATGSGHNTEEETGGSKKSEEEEPSGNKTSNKTVGGGNNTEETAGGEENTSGTSVNNNNNTEQIEGSLVQTDKPLGVLLQALLGDEERKKAKDVLASDEHSIISETAKRLKQHMERGMNPHLTIRLDVTQYEGILKDLFMTSNLQEDQEATSTATRSRAAATLGDDQVKEIKDQIKEIIRMVKQDILDDIQSTRSHGSGEQKLGLDQITRAIEDAKSKLTQIDLKIKEQMIIKGIVDDIDKYLKDKDTLIILEDENRTHGPHWEDIIKALRLLECASKGSAVLVSTNNSQKAKEFCYPQREPITYSLVSLYQDIVLQHTQHRLNNEDESYSSEIIHDILDKCYPHEFCMKMFSRALYANPSRSNKELCRLREALKVSENSLSTIAKKIVKFSYRDLPREHKTCLLYLAIFPQGHNIRRSTLIGRWLTEGLITKEDWPTEVRHAERCFDALIDRCLVCPGDISSKGEYKSCKVGDLVHGFITKIAKKQHILDARLSHLWANHFSIFSGVRLRASDDIVMFVKNFQNYGPQLSLLKLLDLQGCQCFDKKIYLKAICNSIPFLKYLSLRETNVSHLPSEINNLHDLEILDIQQTKVPEKETRHILLPKLRRLLAGGTDPSPHNNDVGITKRTEKSSCSCACIPYKIKKMENKEVFSNVMVSSKSGNEPRDPSPHSNGVGITKRTENSLFSCVRIPYKIEKMENKEVFSNVMVSSKSGNEPRDPSPHSNGVGITERTENSLFSCVRIPYKIEKMENMEVLSNVMASSKSGNELREIRKLWQLRKFGVVIKDNDEHLLNFCQVIGDLKDCLESLSITITESRSEDLKTKRFLPDDIYDRLVQPPKVIESVSIKGFTNLRLLSLLAKGSNELAKVALSGTKIQKEQHLKILAGLPKLRCVRLQDNAYKDSKLTFEADQFEHLTCLLVNGDNMTTIMFKEGAAVKLDKIALCSTNVRTLCGVGRLPMLKEVELKGNESFLSFSEDGAAPQQSTEPVSFPKDRAAPDRSIVHVSPREDATKLVSPPVDGQDPQKSTEIVSSEEERAVRKKNTERNITFKKGEFQHLKSFLYQDTKMIDIIIEDGAALELKNIILSLITSTKSQLSVFGSLPKLIQIELKGDRLTFLSLFENATKATKIERVTLGDTLLRKDDLGLLAKKPNICFLELLENSFMESQFTFNKDEFPKLKLLIVKCSKIRNMTFNQGSAPNLEKIIWSFELESLSGIDNLGKLKELDLGSDVPRQVKKDIKAHKNKPVLVSHIKRPQDQVQTP